MKTYRKQLMVWAAALAVACSGAVVTAADKDAGNKDADQAKQQKHKQDKLIRISDELPAKFFRATDLIGLNVKNAADKQLGDVENIVLHLGQGHVDYLILAHGEVLEIGGERYAVPLGAFQAMHKDETTWLELNVTQQQLAAAPQLKGDTWPAVTDHKWLGTVYTFGYRAEDTDNDAAAEDSDKSNNSTDRKGKQSSKKRDKASSGKESSKDGKSSKRDQEKATQKRNMKKTAQQDDDDQTDAVIFPVAATVVFSGELTGHLSKFDDFQGLDVRTSDGESAGEIQDVVINQTNGRIAYAVVSRGGVLGIGDEHVAIPMDALTAHHTEEDGVYLTIAATPKQFKSESALGEKSWPTKARVSFMKSGTRKQSTRDGDKDGGQKTQQKNKASDRNQQ